MKQIAILLLLFPLFLKAQKIEENKFDKYDSIWKVTSETVKLSNSSGPLSMSVAYMDLQQEKFKVLPHRYYTIYLRFVSRSVTSLNEDNSKVQIEFTNGKVNSYPYKGNYKILSSNDYGTMYIQFDDDETDDLIFTEPIKSIRLHTRNSDYDFEIKDKKSKLIIEYLQAVKEEIKKGQK